MKLKDYLYDKRYTTLLVFLIVTFSALVFYLDPNNKVSYSNIIYIIIFSVSIYFLYLAAGYIKIVQFYRYFKNRNKKEDIIFSLPVPYKKEQEVYFDIMKKIYFDFHEKSEILTNEKKEYSEFIETWIHEVKTPISVINLILENEDKIPEKIKSDIQEENEKISEHVERALYYSKLDSFSKDYFISETDVMKIAKNVIKKNYRALIEKNISIETQNEELSVYTDKKWLFFIIEQIISNSVKYLGTGGKIKISSEKDKKEKILKIYDNGCGIKPEDIKRVFDKGFTGYNGRVYNKSTGIGLYLAQKLSAKLGHRITVKSVYGEFTEVSIHFPLHNDFYNVT